MTLALFALITGSVAIEWPWKQASTKDDTLVDADHKTNTEFSDDPSDVPADALHGAAARGDLKLLESLLSTSTNLDVNVKDSNGWQPIHEAVKRGDVAIVEYLVKHGSQIGEKTTAGGTPLWWSEHEHGDEHPVTLYLRGINAPSEADEAVYDVDIENEVTDGSTELHMFASEGNLLSVQETLRNHPHLLNAADANGWQPLHEAVHSGNLDIVKFLVKNGADLNAKTILGGSPLWWSNRAFGPASSLSEYLRSVGAVDDGNDQPL